MMVDKSVSRRIWEALEQPLLRTEIEAAIGRRLSGQEIRSARSNGYIAKPLGDRYIRGAKVPSDESPRRHRFEQKALDYRPAQLRDVQALVRRVPTSIFRMGSSS